jgi:hypothetical protein
MENPSMKTFQRLVVLSLFLVGSVLMAGCSTEKKPAGGTGTGTGTEKKDTTSDKPANSSFKPAGENDMQLVSVNMPNMT